MSLKVPYVRLQDQALSIQSELRAAFEKVIESGQYILGPSVQEFEAEFAKFCQSSYAVGVSNGTSALMLTLRALGVGPGDEVITAPNSFIASASSVALTGAKPVFADVGADMNMDPAAIERAITPKTKVILPVHLTGRPAPMDKIMDLANSKKIAVVEDAAQSVGARFKNEPVGSWGRAACFSLHPLKNLHSYGDGGVITTSDGAVKDFLIKARNHGLVNRDTCEFWSTNSRLDELQAAFLCVQLKHLGEWTNKRRQLAEHYHQALQNVVQVPLEKKDEFHVYQTYMIQADRRDALRAYLNENGVGASVHYATPIPLQPAAQALGYRAENFPNTMKIVSRILSLPLFPTMTSLEQDRVIELIQEFYR